MALASACLPSMWVLVKQLLIHISPRDRWARVREKGFSAFLARNHNNSIINQENSSDRLRELPMKRENPIYVVEAEASNMINMENVSVTPNAIYVKKNVEWTFEEQNKV